MADGFAGGLAQGIAQGKQIQQQQAEQQRLREGQRLQKQQFDLNQKRQQFELQQQQRQQQQLEQYVAGLPPEQQKSAIEVMVGLRSGMPAQPATAESAFIRGGGTPEEWLRLLRQFPTPGAGRAPFRPTASFLQTAAEMGEDGERLFREASRGDEIAKAKVAEINSRLQKRNPLLQLIEYLGQQATFGGQATPQIDTTPSSMSQILGEAGAR